MEDCLGAAQKGAECEPMINEHVAFRGIVRHNIESSFLSNVQEKNVWMQRSQKNPPNERVPWTPHERCDIMVGVEQYEAWCEATAEAFSKRSPGS